MKLSQLHGSVLRKQAPTCHTSIVKTVFQGPVTNAHCGATLNTLSQFKMAPLIAPSYVSMTDSSLDKQFSLSCTIKSHPLLGDTRKRTSEKRVRFSHNNQVHEPDEKYYTDQDIATKWWTTDELLAIRSLAKCMGSVLRKLSPRTGCSLSMAHRKTTLMLTADFKSLIKLGGNTPDQDLSLWCSQTDGRRGLERFSSRDYHILRKRDIISTRMAVLGEQARQRQQKPSIVDFDVEAIATASRELSRRARTFSLFMAAADTKQVTTDALKQSRPQEEAETGPQSRRAPPRKRSRMGNSLLAENPASSA